MQDLRHKQSPRGLARRTQLLIVAGMGCVIAGIFVIGSLLTRFVTGRSSSEAPETQLATTPGTFRPTEAQWEALKIVPVQLVTFQNERTTEGKIANDDDRTTPVFSPYSGRVTKLFARAGDHVEQGAPLFAVQASEFVQGQNDLISAAAALETARAQLNLAKTTEKRQHDLYDSKGGALKDWQQSQVDLATAQGNFRSAEIALGAVRNRLRILGKSDSEIAAIESEPDKLLSMGYSFIYRENQERYIPIKFSVRGRDLGGAVLEAQRKISEQVRLPAGARLEWVGEFGDLQDAIQRLEVVVPVTLFLIVMLLFANFSSIVDTLLAASVMPMALIGGIFALRITGTPFSVSAAIGFIGLFGISVMEGIIIISYFNQMIDSGLERFAAIWRACQIRLRPVMMTCVAACVGLLPAAISTGIGSQVQKPLALVVVGGVLLAPFLILIILPVLIYMFSPRVPRASEPSEAEPEPQHAE